MPAPRPGAPDGHRRRDIQGLRAVAVLMVVAFHAGLPIPGGFVGVDVFFVISGFVITAALHREWRSTGRIGYRRFYLARFKRLAPALALTVVVTMAVSTLVLSPLGAQQDAAATAAGAMLGVANFVIAGTTGGYFDAPAEANPLLNTWSLSVEEQFYLAFPALLGVGWHLARRRGLARPSPYLVVGALAAASFALAVAGGNGLALPGPAGLVGFYSPLARAWEFAAGALLALALARRPVASPRLAAAAGAAGLALVLSSLWLVNYAFAFPGPWTLLPVAGTALLLAAGTQPSAPTTRALSARPMVAVGDWSYSLYLWHWPLIVFAVYLWPQSAVAAPAAAAAAVVPAVASYRWVEGPIRRLPALGRARAAALVAAVVLPALAAAGAVGLAAAHYWAPKYASGQMSQYRGDIGHDAFHGYVQARFFPCTPRAIREHALYWEGFLRCQQSRPSGPVEVALVGDSHAEHLFLGLAEAFPDANIAYYVLAQLPVRSASADMARIIDHVAADPAIRTVVVAAYWQARGVPAGELAATLRAFRSAGKAVFVTDDVPDFPFEPVQCRDRKAPAIAATECTQDAAAYRESGAAAQRGLRRAVGLVPGVRLLRTSEYFCAADACSMTSGRDLLYRDPDHLNMNGTRFLAGRLAADAAFARAMAP